MSRQDPVMHRLLAKMAAYYEDPDVSEIALCAPGVLFLRARKADEHGRVWHRVRAPHMTWEHVTRVLSFCANTFSQQFNPRQPVWDGVLPGGHRICAIMGAGVLYDEPRPEGGIAVSIRQKGLSGGDISDYGGTKKKFSRRLRAETQEGGFGGRDPEVGELVHRLADAKVPLIISGETGSGKTHLLRQLIARIPRDTRIITVEDTHELDVPHENRVHLITARSKRQETSTSLTQAEAVDVCNRLTPDCIIVGEIGTGNAANAYEIMLTGHSHFMTSIHAGSAEDVPKSFIKRMQHSGQAFDSKAVTEDLRAKVAVIQLKELPDKTKIIDDVYVPPGVPV